MSRITIPTVSSAPTASQPALEGVKKAFGALPNLFAVIGNSPAALSGYLGFSDALAHGALTKREQELLNLHVSELNGCGYCLSAHGVFAKRLDFTQDDIDRAREGFGRSERENALLALARRVVRTGGGHAGQELQRARAAGLTDAEVVEVLAHVASKAFTNAVALIGQFDIDLPRQQRLPST